MDSSKKTILVVEDEPLIMASYVDILNLSGYATLSAENGAVALKVLESNKGKIDLMILDLMMPGTDGLMVLSAMNKEKEKYNMGKFPIIVLTNLSSETVIKEAFNMGASGYIIKTEIQADQLVKELEKYLGNKAA